MRSEEFFRSRPEEASYVVEDIVPNNRLIIAAGYPGEGKSIVGQAILYSVAYGAPFAGIFPTVAGNVMFLDAENRWDILKHRCQKIIRGLEVDGYHRIGDVDFQHYTGFLFDDRSTWGPTFREIDALQPSIISVDHLLCFHHQNENNSDKMKLVKQGIDELMARRNSTLYINHHFNKTDISGSFRKRLRGSTAILADADTAFEVRALSRKRVGDNIRLEKVGLIFQAKKDITPAPIRLRIDEGDGWIKVVYDGDYEPVDDPRVDDLAHKLYHGIFLQDGSEFTVDDVKRHIGGYAKDEEIRYCLRFMEHNLKLLTSERRRRGGGFHYRLHNPSDAEYLVCPWCNERFRVSR